MKRRDLINIFLGSSVAGAFISFLYPVIRYILPTRQTQAEVKNVVAAQVGELAPDTFKIFKFGNTPGILIHTPAGELLAFSAVCTHLTCTVRYESDSQILLCPCHNGKFDLAGNVISGPPPAPLETYIVEIAGEDIVISKKA